MNKPQFLIMITGAILVTTGIVFLVYEVFLFRPQFSHTGPIDPESLKIFLEIMKPESQEMLLEGLGAKTSLQSRYVGLTLVLIGAFLEVIGFMAGKPWKEKP